MNIEAVHTEEEYYNFIGREKAEYYSGKFRVIKDGNKITWNFSAFLFGWMWLCYRKMYGIGIITFIINLIISTICEITGTKVYLLILLLQGIGFGIFGNFIYYAHSNKRLEKIKSKSKDEEVKMESISYEGGVNTGIVIIFVVLYILLDIIKISLTAYVSQRFL